MTGTVNPSPGPFMPRLPRARGDRTPDNFSFVRASGTEDTRTLEDWMAVTAGLQTTSLNVFLEFGIIGDGNKNTGSLGTDNATGLAALRAYIATLYAAGTPLPEIV